MTGTFLAFAFETIAADAVLSNGATTRMQAPLDSADSACVCWVVALPCALVTSTVAPGRSRLDRRDHIGMVGGLPPGGGGALRKEEGDVFAVLAVGDALAGAAASRQRAYQNRAADAGHRQSAPSWATN